MMGTRRALVALMLITTAAAPALAQPKTDPQKQQLAGELVKKAIAKSQLGEHLDAIDLYLQAYTLIRTEHTLLSNVGSEYQKANKPIEALKYFCMYLEKDPTGTNATYAQVKAKALQIELGNKAVVDDDVCKPAAPPPPPATEDGNSEPKVAATKKPSSGSPLRWVGLGVGGVGVAGVVTGLYFGMKAQKESDFITNHNTNDPWPTNIREIEERGERYENRQILFTIAGGTLVAAGLVLFVIGQTSGQREVSVQPTASSDGAGVTLRGSF